ncbi:hypothetical protein J2Y67_004079 [Neobacillus niacini]|nr:hypothetical protein [Neobacillus niacini]
MIALYYVVVMAVVYFAVPFAWPSVHITLIQAATITLLAFLVKTFLAPESPEVYVINGKHYEGESE